MSMTGAGVWVQAGREFSAAEVEHIRETVAWLPRLDRTELAATLCEHLGWYSASGIRLTNRFTCRLGWTN